jgi:hypothetical protein
MIRLTAYVSGRVRWIGYEAKVISLAKEMGLVGMVEFTGASGAYSDFRRVTGPDEIGERQEEGIRELRALMDELKNTITAGS